MGPPYTQLEGQLPNIQSYTDPATPKMTVIKTQTDPDADKINVDKLHGKVNQVDNEPKMAGHKRHRESFGPIMQLREKVAKIVSSRRVVQVAKQGEKQPWTHGSQAAVPDMRAGRSASCGGQMSYQLPSGQNHDGNGNADRTFLPLQLSFQAQDDLPLQGVISTDVSRSMASISHGMLAQNDLANLQPYTLDHPSSYTSLLGPHQTFDPCTLNEACNYNRSLTFPFSGSFESFQTADTYAGPAQGAFEADLGSGRSERSNTELPQQYGIGPELQNELPLVSLGSTDLFQDQLMESTSRMPQDVSTSNAESKQQMDAWNDRQCRFCARVFPSLRELMDHCQAPCPQFWECPLCNSFSYTLEEAQSHLELEHFFPHEDPLTCHICNESGFASRWRRNAHIKEKHNKYQQQPRRAVLSEKGTCAICMAKRLGCDVLEMHAKWCIGGRSKAGFRCDRCGYESKNLANIKRHVGTMSCMKKKVSGKYVRGEVGAT